MSVRQLSSQPYREWGRATYKITRVTMKRTVEEVPLANDAAMRKMGKATKRLIMTHQKVRG